VHENNKNFSSAAFILLTSLVFVAGIAAGIAAGTVLTGLSISKFEPGTIGRSNNCYTPEHKRAAESAGNIAAELERERELNRELHEYNQQARAIAGGITDTAEYNVRNLQEAISLIGEIRTKIKILEDFYAGSGTCRSFN